MTCNSEVGCVLLKCPDGTSFFTNSRRMNAREELAANCVGCWEDRCDCSAPGQFLKTIVERQFFVSRKDPFEVLGCYILLKKFIIITAKTSQGSCCIHDNCYRTLGRTKEECDLDFDYNIRCDHWLTSYFNTFDAK